MLFQLCVVTGILFAQVINIGTSLLKPFGWRISLGLAAVPGTVLLVGGLLLPETPNSLIERGYLQRVSACQLPVPETARRIQSWQVLRNQSWSETTLLLSLRVLLQKLAETGKLL